MVNPEVRYLLCRSQGTCCNAHWHAQAAATNAVGARDAKSGTLELPEDHVTERKACPVALMQWLVAASSNKIPIFFSVPLSLSPSLFHLWNRGPWYPMHAQQCDYRMNLVWLLQFILQILRWQGGKQWYTRMTSPQAYFTRPSCRHAELKQKRYLGHGMWRNITRTTAFTILSPPVAVIHQPESALPISYT